VGNGKEDGKAEDNFGSGKLEGATLESQVEGMTDWSTSGFTSMEKAIWVFRSVDYDESHINTTSMGGGSVFS